MLVPATFRFVLFATLSILILAPLRAEDLDFNRDIRPILSNHCFACHGPDEASVEAGLRLSDAASATRELDSGSHAIVPGDTNESELIARITSDGDQRMPPPEFGKPLSDAQIQTLRQWIAQGAAYAQHWSYVAPVRPDVPDVPVRYQDWPRNPIDHFTLARMLEHGLEPSSSADRYALIRRVCLDLTGLPPTIEEVDAFVADQDPRAYEKLVDDLLQRSTYGEHWARKWLDLARYADSAGYADDPPRTIWAYRDWVIRALNRNIPFDQFTIEQLAGDLLENPTQDQLIATAFHRNTMTNNEGGTQDEEFRNVAIVDRVNTTMAVWMGTTMACAQCHHHKYDPISQEDYFRFFAIWNSTQDADRGDESPRIEILTDEQQRQKTKLESEIARLRTVVGQPTPELAAEQLAWELRLTQPTSWQLATPATATRQSEQPVEIQGDTIRAVGAVDNDTYVIDVNPAEVARDETTEIAAIQLESLPDEQLPSGGSGYGNGNFVVTSVKAHVVPAGDQAPQARYVRIVNHGQQQILSLAEVEVFDHETNRALEGTATQHSTEYSGAAQRAIDGNTDGNYDHESVTHTATVDDPWWELDLGSTRQIERLMVWNRTDNNLHTRLKNFSITLLDADRQIIWQSTMSEAPNPSLSVEPSNIREVAWQAAFADYHQPKFEPQDVLQGGRGNDDGWAVGGQANQPHQLTLVPRNRIEIPPAATLRLIIEQQSPHKHHLLGKFRLRTTSDRVAIDRARLPRDVLLILETPRTERTDEQSDKLADYFRREVAESLSDVRHALEAAEASLANLKPATSVPILRELPKARETRFQFRGSYLDTGDTVEPGLPAVFPPAGDEPLDRLTVARWLVRDDNPLTARVIANRYWEILFGRGIVSTSEEFGSQGELPTHPELLDWLATELHRTDWNMKELLRTLVTSATYRQSARGTDASLAKDPDNRWLSRGPRVRLTAEMVRDQALAVSGLLSSKMYGPPVKPPQPQLGLSAAFGSSTDWQTSGGEDRYRRGIYTTWRRSNPYPSMAAFDAPNREVCTMRRTATNTPLQSLVTLNDPVYVEAAQALARVALQHPGDRAAQIEYAFRRCVSRPPSDDERRVLISLYEDTFAQMSAQIEEATRLASDPLGELPAEQSAPEAAAMTVVANVLLNLDEMISKR